LLPLVTGDCSISAQGHLFKLRHRGVKTGGGPRGRVVGFSAASRKRLLEKLAALLHDALPLFLTFTYPAVYPGCSGARRDFRAWCKRLLRVYPEAALVWRLDLQRRGAPHFHVLLWGVPYLPAEELRAMWAGAIGYSGPQRLQVDVQRVKTWRGVMSYAAKYIGRRDSGPAVGRPGGLDPDPEGGAEGLLDHSAYLPAGGDTEGRVWGVVNAAYLPLAPLQYFGCEWGPWFARIKRYVRRFAERDGRSARWFPRGPAGVALFTDQAGRWYEVAGGVWAAG